MRVTRPQSSFEIVMVDDGSRDRSQEIIRKKCEEDSAFRLVVLSRNFGHQAALLAGLNVAGGQAVVVMDADLQDPPELIPELIDQWVSGSDVVYAQRRIRQGETIFKKLSASIFYAVLDWLTDTHLPRNVGDFRLMDQRVVSILTSLSERSLYLRGMVSWIGFSQTAVEFDRDPRFAGHTKYSLGRMLKLAFDAIISFSEKPLRIVTRFGLSVTLLSFLFLMYLLYVRLTDTTGFATGWLSIIATSLLLGGIQMTCLGIVGEYISRIYQESKGRPAFIIDDRKSIL